MNNGITARSVGFLRALAVGGVFAFLVASSCLVSHWAPDRSIDTGYEIVGHVRDATTAAPLFGVDVAFGLFSADSISYDSHCLSDSTGTFAYSNLGWKPSSQVRTRLTKDGYVPVELKTAEAVVPVRDREYEMNVDLMRIAGAREGCGP